MKYRKALFSALVVGLLGQVTYGGSATWNLNPGTNDWHTATNWTPTTVPDGPSDVATFGISNLTGVSVAAATTVDGIVFNPGASNYTVTVGAPSGSTFAFTLSGTGITNNSGMMQNFVCTANADEGVGTLLFSGNATAGDLCTITTQPGTGFDAPGGAVQFFGAASSGNAMFINSGATAASPFANGGETDFFDASAGNATFFANAGATTSGHGGMITFNSASSGGTGTFTVRGGALGFALGGAITFNDTSTGGAGNYVVEGSTANFAHEGQITFEETATAGDGTFLLQQGDATKFTIGASMTFLANSSAGQATITVEGEAIDKSSRGHIIFEEDSTGATASMIFNGGDMVCDTHNAPGLSVGSIEGSGNIILSGIDLAIGGNNLTTEFSGLISGFGATLTKIGTGTLTLSSANSYSGGTTVSQGILRVTNTTGSATGLGFISVLGGTLGGNGTIGGVVLVGGDNGKGTLAPAAGSRGQSTLTIERFLTFRNKSSYMASFSARNNAVTADLVIADGVTINGATLVLHARTNDALQEGTVITLISNTATTPISGTFRNLADGAIVTVNGNNLQASYEGGDGNDLTLTVVP
jgi:autotransporter-associated beta strand protein